jgi:hypothetical protein
LQEGRENANIDAGLEFIWRISIGTMYVDSVRIENFRTYRNAEIDLLHPDRTASDMKPRFPADILYPNINLVLGNNGMGKSAFLKAIALGCLGPTVRESGIFPYRFVRREPGSAEVTAEIKRKLRVPGKPLTMPSTRSIIKSVFIAHPQDRVPKGTSRLICPVRIDRRADLESLRFLERRPGSKAWNSIFRDDVDAFFFVGYGASRRTEERSNVDQAARRRKGSLRAQRVRSLFEDDATLIPLSFWLPAYSKDHPDRAVEVVDLMNAVTGPDHYRFTGELERDEYLFQRQDQLVPFPALSDGYRAFFGWMSDLLYHVCQSAPPGTPLVKNRGIVMIDEIDLHLHPSWQMEILPSLSRSMPNLQFIVTSHSPLVAGSLQWINLIALEQGDSQSSVLLRKEVAVHGLDADQVLLTPFFSLNTTRTGTRAARLNELRDRARKGDREAAMNVMEELSRGSEQSTLDNPLADPRQEPLAAPPPAEPLPRTSAERARPAKRKKATKRKRAKT